MSLPFRRLWHWWLFVYSWVGISVGSGVAVGLLLLLLVVEGVSAVVADGTVRNGATGAADDGRQLDPILARRLYAFIW